MAAPPTKSFPKQLTVDLARIDGEFTAYLRTRHTADFTVALYRRFLHRVAEFLARHRRCAAKLRRRDVPWVMRGCLPGWKPASVRPRRSGLHQWLKFNGYFYPPAKRARWQSWLDDYERFMREDRALATCTREAARRVIGCFLDWKFLRRRFRWEDLCADDLRRYATLQCRRFKPKSVNDTLSKLRQFLRYLHLRGACSLQLIQAVPCVADFGRLVRPEVLTEPQRRHFLNSFSRDTPEGRRDYTMALCMLDLGLRAVEVTRLRIGDIDWKRRILAVPPAKASNGRQLPMRPPVADALRAYVAGRPATADDHLFVGHALLVGRPLSSGAVAAAMDRAYRRCGFLHWFGTHRLRHSFATRLFVHGVTMKEIADLLGHRLVATTDRYTQPDSPGLRAVSQPWPR